MFKTTLIVIQFVIGVLLLSFSVSECDVIVDTVYGKVRGLVTAEGRAFLGVPFAAPPIGQLRWRSPEKPEPWSGIYDATAVKPGCAQLGCRDMNPTLICPNSTSEDCLYVNVWTPKDAAINHTYPVMAFIHGGQFVFLSGSALLFNGAHLAMAGDVIIVNIEYRLGAFGFLYTGDGPGLARGNYGIQDQRQALVWIQQNIANFGGDPTKVTLFGQSAGAQSTVIHMMSKKARGLFRNAIIESAPFSIPYKNKDEAWFLGETITELLNCSTGDMACLRSRTTNDVGVAEHAARTRVMSLKLLEFFEPIGPWVDGDEVPMLPMEAAKHGLFADIPTMVGTTTEEARIYVYETWRKPLSWETFLEVVLLTYPAHAVKVVEEYPPVSLNDSRDTLVKMGTDFLFTCSTRNVTRTMLMNGHASGLYQYVYNHAISFDGWGKFVYCQGHVCHGSELPILFHTPQLAGLNFTLGEEKLSTELNSYWSNFAYTSDPNTGPHAVDLKWPQYDLTASTNLLFQTPKNGFVERFRSEHCDFWDSIGYKA